MGGVVKTVKKVTQEVERASKKAYDITKILVISPTHTFNKLSLSAAKVLLQGKSFKKTFAKDLQRLGKNIADIYNLVGNKWLGINDDRFLGIKDKNLSRIGKVIKDVFHDDVVQTVGFVIVAAAIIISVFCPPVSGFAATISAAVGTATASVVLAGAVYLALEFGIGAIVSGIISAAAYAMYSEQIQGAIFDYEKTQETLRLTNLNDILSGAILDKMAGGYLYASQFAGDIYYDATTPANCNISVGGEFSLSPHCIRTNIGYIDSTLKNLAGDDGFSVVSMTLDT